MVIAILYLGVLVIIASGLLLRLLSALLSLCNLGSLLHLQFAWDAAVCNASCTAARCIKACTAFSR